MSEEQILKIAARIYKSFKFEQSEERITMTELVKAYKEKINKTEKNIVYKSC